MDCIDIPIKLSCKCGGTLETSGQGDTPADDADVTCKSCGTRIGTWGEVKEYTLQQSAEQINQKLKDVFK
jgi:hypothetical protein